MTVIFFMSLFCLLFTFTMQGLSQIQDGQMATETWKSATDKTSGI